MVSTMEVEGNFLRILHKSAIQPDNAMPLLGKQLKGYVPDGRQTGIASNKRPARADQFTEVKVIHNGAVLYRRLEVRDNPRRSAAVNKFQETDECIWKNYTRRTKRTLQRPKDKWGRWRRFSRPLTLSR